MLNDLFGEVAANEAAIIKKLINNKTVAPISLASNFNEKNAEDRIFGLDRETGKITEILSQKGFKQHAQLDNRETYAIATKLLQQSNAL